MRFVLVAILFSFMLIGSYANLNQYESERVVSVQIADHNSDYIATSCCCGFASVVEVEQNDTKTFEAVKVWNFLHDNTAARVRVVPDYSSLPSSLQVSIDSSEKIVQPLNKAVFSGTVTSNNVAVGTYYVPIDVYAHWSSGEARIESCPIKIVVKGGG